MRRAVAVLLFVSACTGEPSVRSTGRFSYQISAPIHDVASEQVKVRTALATRAEKLCGGRYVLRLEQFSTYYKEPSLIWDVSCRSP
jgi:hypothetical protein